MQKAVKHKRPRIVFDDFSPGCILWGAALSRALGFSAHLGHSLKRYRAPRRAAPERFLRNIKRGFVGNREVGRATSTQ